MPAPQPPAAQPAAPAAQPAPEAPEDECTRFYFKLSRNAAIFISNHASWLCMLF